MLPEEAVQSPSMSVEEGGCGGDSMGGGKDLKKGPWTSAEDAVLVEYVRKHGEGHWNNVQKNSGLSRCGKSCRLRWANHLKPNLKKGAFTQEEEKLIIELHARMGNKWARMAANLPGRTDNEIKNFWNTRMKRCQRTGLPLYPPNTCIQVSNENHEFSSGNKTDNKILQGNLYDMPAVLFDNYKVDQSVSPYALPFPDIPVNSMLNSGFGSQSYGFANSTASSYKYEESETLFPGFHDSVTSMLPTFEQLSGDPSEMINGEFGLGYSSVLDFSRKVLAPFCGATSGSHALLNGNFSASKPLHGTEKLELPSLQYPETSSRSWLTCPRMIPHEAVDMYFQTPSATDKLQSESVSPRNSGLLEELVHEAQILCSVSKQPSEPGSNSSGGTPSDMVESFTPNLHGRDWEAYSDPISPLGYSAASIFSECTPPISSSDELLLSRTSTGTNNAPGTAESVSTSNLGNRGIAPLPDFTRPDALLGSGWLMQGSEATRDYCILNDAIATVLSDDFCGEYKKHFAGTSCTSVEGMELDSSPWNNMPGICPKSELSSGI